ncbi:MAG: hypothetical protein ACWGQW_23850, partial [bacterium]
MNTDFTLWDWRPLVGSVSEIDPSRGWSEVRHRDVPPSGGDAAIRWGTDSSSYIVGRMYDGPTNIRLESNYHSASAAIRIEDLYANNKIGFILLASNLMTGSVYGTVEQAKINGIVFYFQGRDFSTQTPLMYVAPCENGVLSSPWTSVTIPKMGSSYYCQVEVFAGVNNLQPNMIPEVQLWVRYNAGTVIKAPSSGIGVWTHLYTPPAS